MKGQFVMKRFLALSLAILMVLSLVACGKKKSNNFKIATSFYPMYVVTANLTEGAQNVEIMNLIDSNYGCVHNYMIEPQDIKNLEGARIFIASGLEMENFVGKTSLGIPRLEVLESGEDIPEIITEDGIDNPHYWMNIENAISHCDKVSRALIKADPANAEVYEKNAAAYTAKLTELLEEARTRTEKFKGKEMVVLDNTFDYFADEFDIKTVKLLPRHGSRISDQQINEAINYIRLYNVKNVYVSMGEEESDAVRTIKRETGCNVVVLNTLTRGDIDGGIKDAYLNAVRHNLDVLDANLR